jgi:predicted aspartyl protease
VVFAAGNKAVDIPIELNGVHIFVQTRVEGSEPMWFILDTGAAVTVLDTETAEKLGLELKGEIEARGAGEESKTASFISDMSYEVGGAKLMNQRGTAIPLRMLEPMFGRQIDGILGYDFISRFVMTIDYDNKKLHLFDRKGYEYSGNGTVLPIRIEHGHPHLTATVKPHGKEPIEAEYLIDTGAGGSVSFSRPFVEEHDLLSTLPKKYIHEGGGGVGGKTSRYVGRVEKFQLGGLVFDDLICGFSQDRGGAGANPDLAGLIGGDVLQCFTVIFDYERNQMILEPGEKYGHPLKHNLSGMSFKAAGRGAWHELSLRYVMPDSPGAKAGLREDDTVVSVDGLPAAELTVNKLSNMMKEGPRTIEIVIERDGKEMKKKVKLESMI